MKRVRRLTEGKCFRHYRELPPHLWRLVGVQSLMNASHFMAMPLLAVYAAQRLALPASEVALLLGLYFIAARGTPIVIGPLADRFGFWPAVRIGLAMRGAGFFLFPLAGTALSAQALAVVLGLGTAVYEAGAFGIIARQREAIREPLIVISAQGLNLGCVLGPALGAAAALISLSLPFYASGLLMGLLFAMCSFERCPDLTVHRGTAAVQALRSALADRRFVFLCAAFLPWWIVFAQFFSALPQEATLRGDDEVWASAVIGTNGAVGVVALFLAMPILRRIGAVRTLAGAYAMAAGTLALTGFGSDVYSLLLCVALLSVAEVLFMPAAEVLVARYADGRPGASFFALFNTSMGLGMAAGSGLGSFLALSGSQGLLWLLLSLVSLVGLAAMAMYDRLQAAGRPAGAAAPASAAARH